MDPETKKFLRNRRLGVILPWIGIIGIIVLTFSTFFGGLPLFFTEVGFVANCYYWIDEYNWIAERIVFNQNHIVEQEKVKQTKTLMVIMIIMSILTTAILGFLRVQQMYSFILGIGLISGIYFASRIIENTAWIMKIKIVSLKKYYLNVLFFTLMAAILLTLVLYFNQVAYLVVLIVIGIIYVIELDIISEIQKRSARNRAGQANTMQGNIHDDHFF